jgi:hypothetical protein
MGRLPNELLVQIGHYLGRGDQTVIARVSQRLRKVGEEILYPEIDLSERLYHQQTEEYIFDRKHNELMLLHRTLTSCSHLAKLVRRFHICLELYETIDIEEPFHSNLRRPDPFIIFTRIAVKEALCASSLIFDIMDGLEDVIVEMKNPMDYPSEKDDFFERFDLDSASMLNRVALCKLKSLRYDGPRFNHVLASLPALVRLSLNNTSLRSMRKQPTSIPNILKEFSILSLSWLLNPRAQYYADYSNFTKHFLSLKKVFICIDPRRSDNDDPNNLVGLYKNRITVGQFDALVAPLRGSQDSLEILDINVSPHETEFLPFCCPAYDLRFFRSLKELKIPYDGLLGFGSSIYYPGISGLLPQSLESLTVLYPRLDIYRWLEPPTKDKGILPALKDINLHCHKTYNDNYVAFAFLNRPCKIEDELKGYRGIGINISQPYWQEPDEWAEYELESILLDAWQSCLSDSGDSNDFTISFDKNGHTQSGSEISRNKSWLERYQSCLTNFS